MIKLISGLLIASLSLSTLTLPALAGSLNISDQYLKVAGPTKVSLLELPAGNKVNLDGAAEVHLPTSAKTVMVEKYDYPTNNFTSELRAYTFQQAAFWLIATLVLGGAIKR